MSRRLGLTCPMGTAEWRIYVAPPSDPALTPDGQECHAVTLTDSCEIVISDTVHPSRRAEMVVHELLHAAVAASGLGGTQRWGDAREEVVVRALAGPLAHALVGAGLWRGKRVPK